MTNGERLLKAAKEMTVEEFMEKYNGIKPHCRHCEAVQGKPCIKDCNKGMQDWLNAEVPKEYPLSFMELFDFVDGTMFQRAGEESKVYVLFNGWFFRRLKDESRVPVTVSREIVSDKYRVISHSELPSE